eukprot:10598351-Karenia_brevis.AAC.1
MHRLAPKGGMEGVDEIFQAARIVPKKAAGKGKHGKRDKKGKGDATAAGENAGPKSPEVANAI